MQQFIDNLAHWFISDALKQDLVVYTRSRMLISGVVVSWLLMLPVLTLLLLIFHGHALLQIYAAVIIVGGMAIWLLALLTLRFTNNFNFCVHILVGSGIGAIMLVALITGGINSPVLVAIVVPPVIAAIFTNKKIAFSWCAVCTVSSIDLYFITRNYSFENIIPANFINILETFFNALACFLVVGVLYIYEELNHQFQNLLQHEQSRLSELAHHDNLTGLANRLHFDSTISNALIQADETQTLVGLIYIDLDNFKPVNDTHGHETGDQVLKIASQRISRCVRMADTVARLGGDEFAVILEGINNRARMETIAEKIETSMERSMEAFGTELNVGASIGLSLYPDDASSVRELVESADSNMYDRKRRKKSFNHQAGSVNHR